MPAPTNCLRYWDLSNHIRITDDAYPILKQLEAIKKTVLGVLFNDVTEEERRTLAQVARKMAQNLNRAVE